MVQSVSDSFEMLLLRKVNESSQSGINLLSTEMFQRDTSTWLEFEENLLQRWSAGGFEVIVRTLALASGNEFGCMAVGGAGHWLGEKYNQGGPSHHKQQVVSAAGVRLRLAWSVGLEEIGTYLQCLLEVMDTIWPTRLDTNTFHLMEECCIQPSVMVLSHQQYHLSGRM